LITFCTLFSGSSGNAAYLETDAGAILIDCGMSCKQILESLMGAKLEPSRLRAVVITHEHSDHIRGVGPMARKLGLTVCATEGTWAGMEHTVGAIPAHQRMRIDPGESFFLAGMEVASFAIPHDANEPVGYRFFLPRASIAVATDLGHFAPGVQDAVTGADLVLLESNHDPDKLRQNPHYPATLKNRILGKKGHLSNESGAQAAVQLAATGTRHLLLGHLSSENNDPDLAYRTSHAALTNAGAVVGRDVTLQVAGRHQTGYLYRMA
jgi:phosphoribosyl 1,2-cyclic phosphodiesterase